MRVLKIDDLPEKPMGTATAIDGWTGGAVKRTRQELITDGQSDNFRCNVVNFSAGATTGWHAHDSDQILVVTAGRGVVANETEQREITATWCTSRRENATGTAPRRIRYCRTSR
jgi:quercetin dioxygenase-like cupin family protein